MNIASLNLLRSLRLLTVAGPFTSFSWEDWQRIEGGKWRSPGGSILSDAEYQQGRANAGRDEAKPSLEIRGLASDRVDTFVVRNGGKSWLQTLSPEEKTAIGVRL